MSNKIEERHRQALGVNGRLAPMDASRQWAPRLCKRRMLNQHVPPYEKKYHFVESTLVERGEIIEK